MLLNQLPSNINQLVFAINKLLTNIKQLLTHISTYESILANINQYLPYWHYWPCWPYWHPVGPCRTIGIAVVPISDTRKLQADQLYMC